MGGQALFKLAAIQFKPPFTPPLALFGKLFTNPAFLSGCILYALSTVLWVALLSKLELSQAYPLVITMSIILTTLLGIVAFKEHLSVDKIVGLLILCLGVKILSRSLV
jgi:multidrug transporter EmrE-like cation transporter